MAAKTLPDIFVAASLLGSFFENPQEHRMVATKRVLPYLIGTSSYELKIKEHDGDQL